MERASRLLGKIRMPAQTYGVEELVRAAWPLAVGKKVAAHSYAAKLVRTNLVVEVEDEVWRMQLWALRGQILSNLAKQIGEKQVESVEFRVVPRRLGPSHAVKSVRGMDDEAERISDPGLRRIYRAARIKAMKASA
jgi:hypothetical protein